MRGEYERQAAMLLGVTPEDFIPADHPIRRIKPIVDRALRALSPVFDEAYAATGRRSVPPEHLLKGSLLMALFTIRSERQFCERLQYDLLFKWFLDLNIADSAFDHSTFAKNRARLLELEVAAQFFRAVRHEAQEQDLLSAEHFTVDSSLLEAWASLKSFRPRDRAEDAASDDGPPTGGKDELVDFRGETRSNATHASTTDPAALLARRGKGKEAKLSYAYHVLMENRNGLIADAELTRATGTAEVETALTLLEDRPGRHRLTVGGDKAFDTAAFVAGCRAMQITPHVAQKVTRSAIDGRTTRWPGHAVSQRIRKRIEEIFGWTKTVGGSRKLRYLGVEKNRWWMLLVASAYNLVRLARLVGATVA